MGKEKKKFKDTLFGKIVNKAKNILPDTAGIVLQAATGDVKGAITSLKDKLIQKSSGNGNTASQASKLITELDLRRLEIELEFEKVELEEFKAKEENITKRWESDMNSDSKLSKNARPIALGWALGMITILLIVSWTGVKTPDQVLTLFGGVTTSIVGGYFILRTVEKRNKNKYG